MTIRITPWLYDSVDQGTWSELAHNGRACRMGVYNSTGNDGDGLSYQAYFEAGTYTVKVLYEKNTNRGICDVILDGSTLVSIDNYNDPVQRNVVSTTTSVSVATAGVKTFQLVVNGKNGSSTDHVCVIQEVVFYRTA